MMSEKKNAGAAANDANVEQTGNHAAEGTEPLGEEAQKMLEEARAAKEEALALLRQAEEALAAAKTARESTAAEGTAAADAETAARQEQAYLEEKVPIRLFKDGDKYKGDVLVCVNGERLLIKRGETVEIPRKFALVLEQSAQQDADTANLIESKSAEFEAEAKARNL
jgi:hypothetical protein